MKQFFSPTLEAYPDSQMRVDSLSSSIFVSQLSCDLWKLLEPETMTQSEELQKLGIVRKSQTHNRSLRGNVKAAKLCFWQTMKGC